VPQNVYISLPYIMAARTAGIYKTKKLRHCQSLYSFHDMKTGST